MKTAIEQLMIALYEGGYLKGNGNEMDDILGKYKEVEKQQIMNAFDEGQEYEYQYHINNAPKFYSETYFAETYGSKGSDETNGNSLEKVPNGSILKGHLKSKSKGWFVAYNIDAFEGEFPIHPKYEKYYFLDEEDEGKEVEFEIIKYDGTTEISEGWGGYAKLTSKIIQNHIVDTNEMVSSQTEISDEEIEKFASDFYDNNGADEFIIMGAKWYREQLKK